MNKRTAQQRLKEKKISEIVNTKCVQGEVGISIGEALNLMRTFKSGYVILVDQGKVSGIFTETDFLRKVLSAGANRSDPVKALMTPDPQVLSPKSSIGAAIDLMGKHRIYHVPLVDENEQLCGILSVRTLIRFLAEFYPKEVYNLPPKSDQVMETPEGG